MTETLIIFERN